MSRADDLEAAIRSRERALVESLSRWVAIPSISTDPEHAGDMRHSAEFLRRAALDAGFATAEIWESEGHPAVFAELLQDPSLPTVLVYGHHDVQPVDPVDEWEKAPFEALERDGWLLGRGTADDKGHIVMHLEALRGYLEARGNLPINLKLIAEGEEEDGSEHFAAIVAAHLDRLRADVAVISDTGMLAETLPALTVGLRGMAYWELRVEAAKTDLHSGVYGGAVLNPITVLTEMISKLHDADGRVAVPGFYDDVQVLSEKERREIAAIEFDEVGFLGEVGAVAGGENGYSTMERRTIRPTMEICGIWGGYQGEGAKTVIPARAAAKLSSRLVPNQNAEQVTGVVETYLRQIAPEGVRLEFETIHTGRWVLTSSSHPAVSAAAQVVARVWGTPPDFIREGGSIPPVATIADELEVPCVMFGVGLPGDHIHAPNERVVLAQLFKGMQVVGGLWQRYGELGVAGLKEQPDGVAGKAPS
ncbi:MAG TPA: dipeptidase [Candidatus Saccharimonadales bacterium]|nr:dipeptidase [Candidatus Saccharimonadales bacterium]